MRGGRRRCGAAPCWPWPIRAPTCPGRPAAAPLDCAAGRKRSRQPRARVAFTSILLARPRSGLPRPLPCPPRMGPRGRTATTTRGKGRTKGAARAPAGQTNDDWLASPSSSSRVLSHSLSLSDNLIRHICSPEKADRRKESRRSRPHPLRGLVRLGFATASPTTA